MLLPVVASEFPALGGLVFLAIGIASLGLGRDPNGVVSHLFKLRRSVPALTLPTRRELRRDAASG